tara:strand:+ start:5795 stop:6859 length:1065 start_codon:yes stop_codon:yes gene_type:complete
MNIFVLDKNPIRAATMMIDKHVVKMPTESFQMLSTNLHWFGEMIVTSAIPANILNKMHDYMNFRLYNSYQVFNDNELSHLRRNLFEYKIPLRELLHKLYEVKQPYLYKSVMFNHPSTIWARMFDGATYLWLHSLALCNEYTGRYSTVNDDNETMTYKYHSVQKRMNDVYPLFVMYCLYLQAREEIVDDLNIKDDPNRHYDRDGKVHGSRWLDRMRYVSDSHDNNPSLNDDVNLISDYDFDNVRDLPKPAMADKYRSKRIMMSMEDVVEEYRQYYLNGKWSFAEWKPYRKKIHMSDGYMHLLKFAKIDRRPEWWPEDHIFNMQVKEEARMAMFRAKLKERAIMQDVEQRWQNDNV